MSHAHVYVEYKKGQKKRLRSKGCLAIFVVDKQQVLKSAGQINIPNSAGQGGVLLQLAHAGSNHLWSSLYCIWIYWKKEILIRMLGRENTDDWSRFSVSDHPSKKEWLNY